MTNLPTPTALPACTHLWCTDHAEDLCLGQTHTYRDLADGVSQELLVRLVGTGEPVIMIGTRAPGTAQWSELHPDFPLSIAGAAWLARTLHELADQAGAVQGHTTSPQIPTNKITGCSWGESNRAICLDCDQEFDLDSSPHLDRCWQCAEWADAVEVTR